MELSAKLQAARTESGMTQEQTAAHIGVTRQTLSSWENGKTYPDIVSLIKLSDLYRLSLDDLLNREDSADYIGFLDRAIAALKKRQKIYKVIEIAVLALLMLSGAVVFLSMDTGDPFDFFINGQYFFYLPFRVIVTPFVIFVISLMIGVDTSWREERWLLIPAVAGLFILTSNSVLNLPSYLQAVLSGNGAFKTAEGLLSLSWLVTETLMKFFAASGITAAGLGIGSAIRRSARAK